MRAHFSRYGMRGGGKDLSVATVSGVDLTKPNGEMNWSKLMREVQNAIDVVQSDGRSPGMVQRIEIQIQRGAK